jgi:hypothetical protein
MAYDNETIQNISDNELMDVFQAQVGVLTKALKNNKDPAVWFKYFDMDVNILREFVLETQEILTKVGSWKNDPFYTLVASGVKDGSLVVVVDHKPQINPCVHVAFKHIKGMSQHINNFNDDLMKKEYTNLVKSFKRTLTSITDALEEGALTEDDMATPKKKRCLHDIRKTVRNSLTKVNRAYFPDSPSNGDNDDDDGDDNGEE